MLALGLSAASALCRARADQVALDVGEASEYRQHQAPDAGAGVGPRLGQGSKLRLRVHDALDDGEQVESAAREAVDPRNRRREPACRASGLARAGRGARPSPSRGRCFGGCIRLREAAQAGCRGSARRC
jgi:hypothetical protein